MKNIEKHDREKRLDERVRVLETFVVRLEEKLELLEQEKKGIKATDYTGLKGLVVEVLSAHWVLLKIL